MSQNKTALSPHTSLRSTCIRAPHRCSLARFTTNSRFPEHCPATAALYTIRAPIRKTRARERLTALFSRERESVDTREIADGEYDVYKSLVVRDDRMAGRKENDGTRVYIIKIFYFYSIIQRLKNQLAYRLFFLEPRRYIHTRLRVREIGAAALRALTTRAARIILAIYIHPHSSHNNYYTIVLFSRASLVASRRK